jgi:hypothetical protein
MESIWAIEGKQEPRAIASEGEAGGSPKMSPKSAFLHAAGLKTTNVIAPSLAKVGSACKKCFSQVLSYLLKWSLIVRELAEICITSWVQKVVSG